MSPNDTAVDDDYVVKLPSGDARMMSVDELDAALEAGTIHKDSPVLAPGTTTWTTLGVLAGLDDVAPPANSLIPPSPSSIAPMVLSDGDVNVDLALADDDGLGLVPRRRAAKVIGMVFGAVAVFAVIFGIKGAVDQAIATSAGEAALAAQPPAPPPLAALAALPPVAPRPSAVAEAAPPAPAPAAAPPPVTSKPAAAKPTAAKDKDKKTNKLPGAPKAAKKK